MSRRIDESATRPHSRPLLHAYLELAKPRITLMVAVTAAMGFLLAHRGTWTEALPLLALTLLGVGLSAGGAGALNHYLEREADGRMRRTRNRPLVTGEIHPSAALRYGVSLALLGVLLLLWQVNLITAFLALLTVFLYVLVYTPMKRWSWWNTLAGAVPGALPPMGGWTAATGTVDPGAWVLFAILFVWQMPHFYAIAWIFREDYARGGFQMLPTIDDGARRTMRQILGYAVALAPVSLLLTALGVTGAVYAAGALLLGIVMLAPCFAFAASQSIEDARRVLRASVVYLPMLMVLILIDRRFL